MQISPDEQHKMATIYKSEKRDEMVKEGYRIRGNSDQVRWIDAWKKIFLRATIFRVVRTSILLAGKLTRRIPEMSVRVVQDFFLDKEGSSDLGFNHCISIANFKDPIHHDFTRGYELLIQLKCTIVEWRLWKPR
ncbi:unnamed protein product [Thlaspi arvense]|uniref:Uncharacterized protein n=1 Tax=Thlaspi arvense TaxID=13288 RepID=A0AAU9SPH8_THLAR|nr:unnamed protein product [Thlaspi arvense]